MPKWHDYIPDLAYLHVCAEPAEVPEIAEKHKVLQELLELLALQLTNKKVWFGK